MTLKNGPKMSKFENRDAMFKVTTFINGKKKSIPGRVDKWRSNTEETARLKGEIRA